MKKQEKELFTKSEPNGIKALILAIRRLRMKDLLFVFYDVAVVAGAYFIALWFRFDCNYSEIPPKFFAAWMKFAPIYMLISIVVFWGFRLYKSLWKYASVKELQKILKNNGRSK